MAVSSALEKLLQLGALAARILKETTAGLAGIPWQQVLGPEVEKVGIVTPRLVEGTSPVK